MLLTLSTLLHLAALFLFWKKTYACMPRNRARLNLSFWLTGLLGLAYCMVLFRLTATWDITLLLDCFQGPAYLLAFTLPYLLLANLIYSIYLLCPWRKKADASL